MFTVKRQGAGGSSGSGAATWCVYRGTAAVWVGSSVSPVGIEEDVDQGGGDGRQRVRVQRHHTELVLRDQHRVNRRLGG